MDLFTPSSKIKKSTSGNLAIHLATYQGDLIRNSATFAIKVQFPSLRNKNRTEEFLLNRIKRLTPLPTKSKRQLNNLKFHSKAPVLYLKKHFLSLTPLRTKKWSF